MKSFIGYLLLGAAREQAPPAFPWAFVGSIRTRRALISPPRSFCVWASAVSEARPTTSIRSAFIRSRTRARPKNCGQICRREGDRSPLRRSYRGNTRLSRNDSHVSSRPVPHRHQNVAGECRNRHCANRRRLSRSDLRWDGVFPGQTSLRSGFVLFPHGLCWSRRFCRRLLFVVAALHLSGIWAITQLHQLLIESGEGRRALLDRPGSQERVLLARITNGCAGSTYRQSQYARRIRQPNEAKASGWVIGTISCSTHVMSPCACRQ